MISEFDKKHLGEILGGYGDWFTADLLRLCAHADGANLERLELAFPEVVAAFKAWQTRESDYA